MPILRGGPIQRRDSSFECAWGDNKAPRVDPVDPCCACSCVHDACRRMQVDWLHTELRRKAHPLLLPSPATLPGTHSARPLAGTHQAWPPWLLRCNLRNLVSHAVESSISVYMPVLKKRNKLAGACAQPVAAQKEAQGRGDTVAPRRNRLYS